MLALQTQAARPLQPRRDKSREAGNSRNSSLQSSGVASGAGATPAPFLKQGAIMLRFEKLTVKAQEALQDAHEVAARHENQEITPLHLLAALTNQADGGIFRSTARPRVERHVAARVQGSRQF